MSLFTFRMMFVLIGAIAALIVSEIGNVDFYQVTSAMAFVMVLDIMARETFIRLVLLQAGGTDKDGNNSESE